jgi:hypothetical protein
MKFNHRRKLADQLGKETSITEDMGLRSADLPYKLRNNSAIKSWILVFFDPAYEANLNPKRLYTWR